uniref:NADH-ubiquinone oxidoreductase chain 5 n=1 Tax=Ceratina okinawana TaxID=236018 RepID=A0A7U0M7V8_9HYME|nr:NADH dehydrogenase subunit 5 [Ceratina okinawana]QQX27993.1 NADH dehydrogenase subunit 5 [Ceratina okinawana]
MLNMMICSIMFFIMSFLMLFLGLSLILFNKIYVIEWLIFKFSSMKLNLILLLDDLSLIFIYLVLMISSVVMIYSISYMTLEEIMIKRFFYLLMLFVFSMCLMIISPNLLTIILGWDGLGLISYCLIIYYQNNKAYNSGMLTMILNRLGDCSLLMLIGLMGLLGSWNLFLYNNFISMSIILLIILMSFTKSAQMPFSSWLPAAMMAPTPISSLVHSSTLVTAGIYLLIRYNNFLNLYMIYILLISSFTMLLSGLFANYEIDFKKIIALSTLSQLGFMMSILSLGYIDLTFLHLIIHALFKSLMFLCVGSFIHYNNGSQDLRDYSGMFYIYPFKSMILLFTLMSLSGFPFLVGFYSKDLIMECFFFSKMNMLSFLNLFISTLMTISYSVRLILIIMLNNNLKFFLNYIKEDLLMNLCMLYMMINSIFFSQFYLMMKFSLLSFNLDYLYKVMMMKLYILGLILGYQFYYMMYWVNMIGFLMKNMFYLNNMYSSIYLYPMKLIYSYEFSLEKFYFQNLLSDFMVIILNIFNMKIYYVYLYMLLMMYLYLYLLMLL